MQVGILSKTAVSALALVAMCCAGCRLFPARAVGFRLSVVDTPGPTGPVCDGHELVLSPLGNHRFRMNEIAPLNMSELRRILDMELRMRAEKVVFVRSESDVAYRDFVELLAGVYRSDTRFGLMTQKILNDGGCFMLRGWTKTPDGLQGSALPAGLQRVGNANWPN